MNKTALAYILAIVCMMGLIISHTNKMNEPHVQTYEPQEIAEGLSEKVFTAIGNEKFSFIRKTITSYAGYPLDDYEVSYTGHDSVDDQVIALFIELRQLYKDYGRESTIRIKVVSANDPELIVLVCHDGINERIVK